MWCVRWRTYPVQNIETPDVFPDLRVRGRGHPCLDNLDNLWTNQTHFLASPLPIRGQNVSTALGS